LFEDDDGHAVTVTFACYIKMYGTSSHQN
jgi:hypothetical protein